jgi:hypothetical protein
VQRKYLAAKTKVRTVAVESHAAKSIALSMLKQLTTALE